MKAIKFAASALTVLALAVSAGCQMLHSPAPTKPPVAKSAIPQVNVDFDFDMYSVKLRDPKAPDVDWQRLENDILAQASGAQILMRGNFKSSYAQSQEVHLSAEVTPEIFRKALEHQGKVATESTHATTVNGLDMKLGYTDSKAFLKLPLCQPDVLVPGKFSSTQAITLNPLIRSEDNILLTYEIKFTPEILIPGCPDTDTRSILPGAHGMKRVSASTVLKGNSVVVSGLREQVMDPVTQSYADNADNEIKIVVIKPTIRQ
ncbi:hypothetical protein [Pseudomonas serbica]|uniref:hypothetical protein n=1 Tax=Pseudomonas serbica TaxID=2965074 RepID=UPI00237B9F52|nr:hypothetical protein [Pseudomonas serbica]